MNSQTTTKTREGVFGPRSHAFLSVLIYGMLFVTLMVATGGSITLDNLLLPIVAIYASVRIIEFIVKRRQEKTPQWLVVGSFGIGAIMAVMMTILSLST
ncbi:hypothetical protein [Geomicrobium sp. JCM 19038]|uniref:hypothetical protein n=1 Tax=Geomicrobium sp. JCM 19038 TaxID=1460635 RepID=UPI000693974F|nr:hypothetical protein [Geomicrobium sp. JCM 19038]